jgi:signal transduction histidine kinase
LITSETAPVERGLLQGQAAFRWVAWLWMAATLVVARDQLERDWIAIGLVGLALAVTIGTTVGLRHRHQLLLEPPAVLAELAVGAALILADGVAFGDGHAFSTSQSLGSVWPLVGIFAAAITFGPAAAVAGAGLGLCRVAAVLLNGASIDTGGRVLSLLNTTVFYAIAGGAGGYAVRALRRAEREVSAARARDEVARTLHDGVLQTLAVIERRSDDPTLARLAREQERELREYLFGVDRAAGTRSGDLATALRAAAARFEDAFGGRVDVLVADDLPAIAATDALTGAVGEALVNAGKHGRASKVTVFVEPADDGGVFCSVKDDGVGFDVASTPPGIGLQQSIAGRVAEAGGRSDVRSRPGSGTEVTLWLP